MCIYMCVEVVLINILASHLAPPNKNFWLRPCPHFFPDNLGLYNSVTYLVLKTLVPVTPYIQELLPFTFCFIYFNCYKFFVFLLKKVFILFKIITLINDKSFFIFRNKQTHKGEGRRLQILLVTLIFDICQTFFIINCYNVHKKLQLRLLLVAFFFFWS